MRAYQEILPQIEALGARLVGISPQTPDNTLTTAEKHALKFPVLSDAGNRVARSYRLVYSFSDDLRSLFRDVGQIDLTKFNGDESWELPLPGTFVVAPDGTVRAAFVNADYTLRMEPGAALEALRKIRGG